MSERIDIGFAKDRPLSELTYLECQADGEPFLIIRLDGSIELPGRMPDDERARRFIEMMSFEGTTLARAAFRAGQESMKARAVEVAKTKGVYPELNVWNGGPEWYRHGQEIASAIAALEPVNE